MQRTALSIILNYKRTNTYALNVIIGALESKPGTQDVEFVFAKKQGELVAAVQDALNKGRRVVIGWSLHSTL